jgi:hypothetical protein
MFAACPDCGGAWVAERVDLVYTTDIPPRARPQVTQYRVAVCRCLLCGKQVRGQQPDVAPDQYGATAHAVGDRAMAAAHGLHYGIGIPVRKVPRVLAALTGVTLTPGTVGAVYEDLRTPVPKAAVVHTDDTSWRIGGEAAYLMAFDTDEATVYQIRSQHRHAETPTRWWPSPCRPRACRTRSPITCATAA